MNKLICERCKHCESVDVPHFLRTKSRTTITVKATRRPVNVCKNDLCTTAEIRHDYPNRHGVPLDIARNICDREGDGRFVYFEPKEPQTGAAAAAAASDWRRELNKDLREPQAANPKTLAAAG